MSKHQLNTLLVDDNEQDYTTTRRLLAELDNWQVNLEWVSTYEAALAKMERSPYDICLLNCCLGNHKGLDFLRHATKNGSKPSLIMLTDPENREIAVEALDAGAIDYLVKGQIDTDLLERSIRYAIKYRQLETSLETTIQERTAQLTAANQKLQQEVNLYKQQANAHKESERQYRMFFDIDIYGVEVLDAQGNIIDCNATYQNMLGYSQKEIVGQHVAKFTSDASTRALKKMLANLQQNGYAEGERKLICKDGSTILVWSRSRALRDSSGNFSGVVTFSRDITERMKAVKQISTLARALEQSPMALMITDADGNIEYTNFEFTELTGYSYDEIMGQNLRAFKMGQESEKEFNSLWDVITTDDQWQGDLHCLKNDGTPYWASVTIAPMFDARGTLTDFIVMQEDITARKEEESEAFRSQRRIGDLMTEHISDLTTANEKLQQEIAERQRVEARLAAQYKGFPVPTYSWEIVGDDFILVDYNHAAEEDSRGRIAKFKGQPASQIFKDRPQVLADFERCYRQKKLVRREAPYQLVTTGQTKHYVTTYNFVAPNLIIVHIEDITRHKQLEVELDACRQQLDALAINDDTEITQTKNALAKEIARRQQAEQALQEAEERLKEVASNIDERLREQYRSIPIPTYTWQMIGGEFVLIDFNDAAAESMGRIVDFYGKTASQIFKDRPQVLADFTRCYNERTKVVREAPYQLVTTGETRYFVTTYNFVPPNLVVDHIQDITEQKQLEAELADCKDHLEALLAAGAEPTRQKVQQLEAELQEYKTRLDTLVKEKTAQLTKKNQELQEALVKHERAEESLRQNRTRLRAQYTGIPIPTYSWQRVGNDFVLTDYNNAAEKVTQGRIADFMGKPVSEVFADRPEVVKDFTRCFEQKTSVERESHYQLLTADETKFYVTTYNYVPPNLVIVYINDVTTHKQTEERLRNGEEQVDLICRLSPEADITFVNDAYCWYFNQPRRELIGRKIPFVFEEDLQKVKTHIASLRQEEPVGTIEYRVVKQEGDIRWQQWVTRSIFDRQGRPVEIRSVGRDITRRKEGV